MTSSSRRLTVVLVIAVTLLALSAQPVAALQTNTALGSIHTNDTDFSGAAQLTNVSVAGSGESASVELDSNAADDFEDGDIAEYSGATGFFSAQSTTVNRGSFALEATTGGSFEDIASTTGLEVYPSPGDTVEVDVQLTNTDDSARFLFGVQSEASAANGYAVAADAYNDEVRIYIRNSSGVTVLASSAASISSQLNEWLTMEITWQADGTIQYTLYDSARNQLGTAQTTNTEFSSGGSGYSANNVVGAAGTSSTMYFDGPPMGEGPGTYISANQTVDNAQTGFTNLTLNNASAEVTWQEFSGSSWTDIASNTFTTTGNHTIDISAATNSDLRVNVTFEKTGSDPTAELHDEGVQFTNHEPEIDNSSASPTGTLNQATQTLSVDVNDTEFGTAQGDALTAEFFVDGSSIGTDTLNSNGTAQLSHTFSGGDHTWHAVVSDSYGLSNTSDTFSVTTPANITIREEAEPHEIVNKATITVLISGSGQTVDRQTVTDGNVSLSGLPTTEEYVVLVNATGYHQRAILVESIFEQSSVFVLNTSRASIENTFIIEDRSGSFPPSGSKLLIQKPVNRSLYDSGASTSYQWLTIGGDRLGADQSLTLALVDGGRYRLIAENQEGDRRVLGEYTAVNAGTVNLRVGNVEVTPDDSTTYGYDASYLNSSGSKYLKFQFNDSTDGTTDLRLIIHEYGNESNEIENSTHAGPYGTFSFTENLSAISTTAVNTTWVVKFEATRGGQTITGSAVVGKSTIGNGIPIAPMWLHVGSVGFLILLSGLVGGLVNPGAGAATISLAGGVFWHLGFLPSEIGGGAIALGMLLSAAWIVAFGGSGLR